MFTPLYSSAASEVDKQKDLFSQGAWTKGFDQVTGETPGPVVVDQSPIFRRQEDNGGAIIWRRRRRKCGVQRQEPCVRRLVVHRG